MIRRGLQVVFLCGITFLGAAPSFGQLSKMPQNIYLQDRSWTGTDPNGWYVQISAEGDSTGSTYRRFTTDPATSYYFQISYAKTGTYSNTWELRLFNTNSMVSYTSWVSTNYPTLVNITGGGIAKFDFTPDPYEEAFPDWESAAVKIPLGFSFAMAFWASAVALSVAMKWVRDLASAAT